MNPKITGQKSQTSQLLFEETLVVCRVFQAFLSLKKTSVFVCSPCFFNIIKSQLPNCLVSCLPHSYKQNKSPEKKKKKRRFLSRHLLLKRRVHDRPVGGYRAKAFRTSVLCQRGDGGDPSGWRVWSRLRLTVDGWTQAEIHGVVVVYSLEKKGVCLNTWKKGEGFGKIDVFFLCLGGWLILKQGLW